MSGKLFSLSVSQLLHVEGGNGNSACLLGLIGVLNKEKVYIYVCVYMYMAFKMVHGE